MTTGTLILNPRKLHVNHLWEVDAEWFRDLKRYITSVSHYIQKAEAPPKPPRP